MKKSTRIITSVIMFLMIFIQAGCGSKSTTSEPSDTDFAEQMQEASTTPYGKYPELVTYTLGKLTGSNNSNMPESDTYEDNAYTRFLRDFLNIQNKDVFEEADEQYDSSVTMAIQSGNMPDIMIVSDIDDVNMLVEYDMIEDLTQAYDNCMSERIKEIYAGYGDSIKDLITFDGKIMAIPETNIDDGPNLIWLRKDWMDKLGLAAPKHQSDVEYIIKQFIQAVLCVIRVFAVDADTAVSTFLISFLLHMERFRSSGLKAKMVKQSMVPFSRRPKARWHT